MITALVGFAAFAVLIAVTPGPDSLLVLRNGVSGGRQAGIWTGVGAAAGSLVWGLAAAVGLAAVLQQWDVAYEIIKYGGATYLAFLGLQSLLQRIPVGKEPTLPSGEPTMRTSKAFGTGLWSNLLNPKVGLFFLAVAPQFLPQGYSPLMMTVLFGFIDAVVALVWLSLLALLTSQALHWLRRPRVRRYLERGTGLCLLGLAVAAAAEIG